MSKGRKPATKKVEEKPVEVVQDQITDSVTAKEETVVVSEVKKEVFTMDITEFGVKLEDAEKFVKTAIRFYFENKDKKLFDEPELKKMKEFIESKSNEGNKFEESLQKIKRFEDQIKMNQFIPKKTVLDFLKDLKG
jgi:hypothetical protein